jgi:hypothetical protein
VLADLGVGGQSRFGQVVALAFDDGALELVLGGSGEGDGGVSADAGQARVAQQPGQGAAEGQVGAPGQQVPGRGADLVGPFLTGSHQPPDPRQRPRPR